MRQGSAPSQRGCDSWDYTGYTLEPIKRRNSLLLILIQIYACPYNQARPDGRATGSAEQGPQFGGAPNTRSAAY